MWVRVFQLNQRVYRPQKARCWFWNGYFCFSTQTFWCPVQLSRFTDAVSPSSEEGRLSQDAFRSPPLKTHGDSVDLLIAYTRCRKHKLAEGLCVESFNPVWCQDVTQAHTSDILQFHGHTHTCIHTQSCVLAEVIKSALSWLSSENFPCGTFIFPF